MRFAALLVLVQVLFWHCTRALLPAELPGDPVAQHAATVVLDQVRVTVLTDALLRLEYTAALPGAAFSAGFEDRRTFVVWNRNLPVPPFTHAVKQRVTAAGQSLSVLEVNTSSVRLQYSFSTRAGAVSPLNATNTVVTLLRPRLWMNVTQWKPGDSAQGNLFGTFRTLDALGGPQDMNCSQLAVYPYNGSWYSHHPCSLGVLSKAGWALVDDSRSPVMTPWFTSQTRGSCAAAGHLPSPQRASCFPFQWNAQNESTCLHAGCCWLGGRCVQRAGNIDWYLFAHGMAYEDALADFAAVSGKIPIPRRHFLGVSWSRWGNEWTQAKTYMQVESLANASFPLDTYIFDMNWHMKPDWTGYSWDTHQYPDHVALLQWMHQRGLYIGANLHDASGVMGFEKRYAAMARANGIDPASNATVPFRISNLTYATTLHELVLEPLAAEGLDFWWTDWQQGVLGVHDCAGSNPTMMLNHYRFMNYSDPNGRRGLFHSRWGGLGDHRYATGFGGDFEQTWSSLSFMAQFTSTAANVLQAWWGLEIMCNNTSNDNATNELFTRVNQFGAWSPVFTSWGNDGMPNNLWSLPSPYQEAVQRALAMRNQLLPYRYTLGKVAHDSGISPVRPMYLVHPQQAAAYNSPQQYMFGPELLVAPSYTPVDASGVSSSKVWFPPSSCWLDFWNASAPPHTVGVGQGEWVTVHVPLDRTAVFVRCGAVMATLPAELAIQHGIASRPYDVLDLRIYPGASAGSAWLYEDDGISNKYISANAYSNTSVQYTYSASSSVSDAHMLKAQLSLQTSGPFVPDTALRRVRVLATTRSPHSVSVDGKAARAAPAPCTSVAAGEFCVDTQAAEVVVGCAVSVKDAQCDIVVQW